MSAGMLPSSGQIAASRAMSMPGCASNSAAERGTPSALTARPWRRSAVGGQAQFGRETRAPRRAPRSSRQRRAARSPPTAPIADPDRGQALVGVVGAQGQPVFGARGEHAVGLAGAAGHEVVDQHADIGVGPVEHERRPPPDADSAALSPAISPCAAASS